MRASELDPDDPLAAEQLERLDRLRWRLTNRAALLASAARAQGVSWDDRGVRAVSVQLPVPLADALATTASRRRTSHRRQLEALIGVLPADRRLQALADAVAPWLEPDVPCRHVNLRLGSDGADALEARRAVLADAGRYRGSLRTVVIVAVALAHADLEAAQQPAQHSPAPDQPPAGQADTP